MLVTTTTDRLSVDALSEEGMAGSDWLRPTARLMTVDAGCPSSLSALTEAGIGVARSPHTEGGVGAAWAATSWKCNSPASVSALSEAGESRTGLSGSIPQTVGEGAAPKSTPVSLSALTEEEKARQVPRPTSRTLAHPSGSPSSVSALSEAGKWPSPGGPQGMVKTVSRVTYGTAEDWDFSSFPASLSALGGARPRQATRIFLSPPPAWGTGSAERVDGGRTARSKKGRGRPSPTEQMGGTRGPDPFSLRERVLSPNIDAGAAR